MLLLEQSQTQVKVNVEILHCVRGISELKLPIGTILSYKTHNYLDNTVFVLFTSIFPR